MHQQVGPYRIEVLEPLQRVRVVCDGDDHGVGLDLTWEGSFAAVEEEAHLINNGYRTILQSTRFAQLGTWTGEVRVGGDTIAVEPSTWLGSRDRSWGIRPVGDADAPGRTADDTGTGGFWWLYVPLRFDEFSIIVMAQERPDGYRTLNDAKRVWADGRVEQLGWPVYDITLPLRLATPRARHAADARHAGKAGDGRDRHPRVRAAAPRPGLRRRRLGPRPVEGRGVGRGGRRRPHRSRGRAAHPVRQHRPRRPTRSATAPRASACSSTRASARTRRPASPTSCRWHRERRRPAPR